MHKTKKQCLCTIVCEVLLLASNSSCQVLRSSATSPVFPPRTEYPLLRSGREQNPAVAADKLRSLSQIMVWNIALFTDQREWFCPVLTLPSMDLQNHPDLIPPSSVLSTYPNFSWNSWVFPSGDPHILSASLGTAGCRPSGCSLTFLLYFSILGNTSLSRCIHSSSPLPFL